MKRILARFNIRTGALALGVAALVACSALAASHIEANKSKPAVNIPLDESSIPRASGPYTSFAPIVKKVTPAVVKVVVTIKGSTVRAPEWFGFNDPFWRHFFGEPFGGQRPNRQFQTPPQYGLGSGVIVTKDGYILTNNHVVDHADKVRVTLQDGREFTAKVIGRDPKSDIAVIKIDAKHLPVVPMADSSKVQVGDIVLAIGNPFGVGQTVTSGIVSAKDRGNLGIEDYEDFIQTDAAINPGNSGGALVDVEGRLIGINTAIYSRSGGNQGIGFAIPSDLARSVMESLIKYGHVTRGYLGLMIQDVTPALAKEFDLKEATGALVGDVLPKGPAAKAGFKDGDVVLKYDGKPVPDSREFRLAVSETKPGTTVPVEVLRDGKTKRLEVKVQQLPGSEQVASNNGPSNPDNGTLNGVTVSDLDQQTRQELKVPDNVQGVVITEVQPGSPSAEAGLKAGDIIRSINRHPVKTAEEAVHLTEHPKSKVTLLRIWSNGGSHYVVVNESKTD